MRRLVFLFLALGAAFAGDEQFNGRWDITVPRQSNPRGWWLEVTGAGTGALKGRFVGFPGGDMNDIPKIAIRNGELQFGFEYREQELNQQPKMLRLEYSARLADDKLLGVRRSGGQALQWIGVRAPVITDKDDGSWREGAPMELFHHQTLAGWKGLAAGRELGWSVKNGAMANQAGANNLVTEKTFWNFKLHVEYRVGPHSNSGIGLRGRYEVQILEDYGSPPDRHSNGALYSRIAPTGNASRPAGEWQTYDIRLVGRQVTVVLNDQKIIDKQEIEGLTAIASNADEGQPGPIILQGDHGPVEFRSVVLTPLVK